MATEHEPDTALIRNIASGETGAGYHTAKYIAEKLLSTRANLDALLEAAKAAIDWGLRDDNPQEEASRIYRNLHATVEQAKT